MSVTSLSNNPDKIYKTSFRWRKNSGELDVFEAARYYENPGPTNFPQKPVSRISLDMPISRNPINHIHPARDKKQMKENKKYKQPSSPGAKLASFINSIFNQTSSKKKKSKPGGENNHDDEERRKRRSSISHFRIIKTDDSSNPSNFYASTPIKSSLFRRFPDSDSDNIFQNHGNFGLCDRNSIRKNNLGNDKFRKFSDVDDGGDSDSSSDLFDLPNHELDYCSSGLPVYGTTHIARIRIGEVPISSTITV